MQRALVLLALLAVGQLAPAAATTCSAGEGVKTYQLVNFLSALLNTTQREPACEPCGWQQVSPGGEDAECSMCEPFVSAPNTAKTACDCLPGAYVVGPAAKGSSSTCAACADNAISTTKNAASCKVCPAGAVAERGTKCVCATGYVATGFGDDGVTGCRACGDNEVSPGGASRTCSACPAGALPLADKSACGCPAGQRLLTAEPLKCAACTTVFEVTRDTNRMMMCQQCSPFSYANDEHTGCVCAAGYFARNPEAASVQCSQCPEGTHKPTAGNGGVEACLPCPAGLASSNSRKQCVKPPCPAGTEKAADGTCKACDAMSYNHLRDGKCKPCANNTAANPSRTSCDVCVDGALQTSQTGEPLSCMSCMHGWKWNFAASKCDVDPDFHTSGGNDAARRGPGEAPAAAPTAVPSVIARLAPAGSVTKTPEQQGSPVGVAAAAAVPAAAGAPKVTRRLIGAVGAPRSGNA